MAEMSQGSGERQRAVESRPTHSSPSADPDPFLSIIIPAYNEAQRLPQALQLLRDFLESQPYIAEVLVVDDGSGDETAAVVGAQMAAWPALQLLRADHAGKGHAIRLGALAARGAYVFFCDADLSMPIDELPRLLSPVLNDSDMAIAAREGPGARRYGEPLYRHMLGRLFNSFVRIAIGLPLADTQCGFKCLRAEVARDLCTQQTIDGWAFDVELLAIARQRGYRVVEIPVPWHFSPSSRLQPLRDALRMAHEVWTIRANDRKRRYATIPGEQVGAPISPRHRVRL
jgi:dolichyl-phosphate beta-glucosyltransferase